VAGSAFRRIYIDLETELADRLKDQTKLQGKSQRQLIRDAVDAAVTKWEKEHGKSKAK
jgi:metal-responsive CopG/Arc/MetJ family transcriptional regulator